MSRSLRSSAKRPHRKRKRPSRFEDSDDEAVVVLDLDQLVKKEAKAGGTDESDRTSSEEGAKRSRNQAADAGANNPWHKLRRRMGDILLKMRLDRHLLRSYEEDGWRRNSERRIKPSKEIERAAARVRRGKCQARALLREIWEMNADGPRWDALEEDEEGNIDLFQVVCTRCGSGDDCEGNDILLCDHKGCFRAYHQQCLEPPLASECLLGPDWDWFCW